MPPDVELDQLFQTLCADSQAALIDLLQADLDLASTMLDKAALDAKFEPGACEGSLRRVRSALATVRRFLNQVIDNGEWENLQGRLSEVEQALMTFGA